MPTSVHAALGAEIIHQHPTADGATLGATSHRDFKRLAGTLPDLDDGGVVLNLGSAVVMPEVFLKALTIARNLHAHVNLIPYNTVEGLPWKRPSITRQERFADILRAARISVTLRREKGHDIDAACGQLRLKTEKERVEEQVASST